MDTRPFCFPGSQSLQRAICDRQDEDRKKTGEGILRVDTAGEARDLIS